MSITGFIKAFGISYAGTLPKIKKSADQLQPIFEAFTNSLESIRMNNDSNLGKITIKIILKNHLFSNETKIYDFDSIIIEDSGIGFNATEFERLENLNDTRKGFFNKGSGRVQFLHYFDKTEYNSIFKDPSSSTGFKQRIFTLSKSEGYLRNNAIIHMDNFVDAQANEPLTTVIFKNPLSDKDLIYYQNLSIEELKDRIISRYLPYLCENRDSLPKIKLEYYIGKEIFHELEIASDDIPPIDQQKDIIVNYTKMLTDGKTIEKTDNIETFNLKAFKIPKEKLNKNGLKLTSKGEVAKEIKLESLLPEDYIDDKRYLFLVSGKLIDTKDGDTRGNLSIPTLEEFKKTYGDTPSLFTEEEIILDDLQEESNNIILSMYEEIRKKIEEKENEIEKLKSMFLLSPESIKDAKIKINDSEERILEKVYQADAKLIAKKDAEIKKRIDSLDNLNPNSEDFDEKLNTEIDELTKAIPLQNRTALTHYVARRKLVLKLFDKILNRKLKIQNKTKRKFDEGLLHNLLFQQGSDKPDKSDLWIINEDFIYFKGISESSLSNVEIDGKKLFKKEFSIEEEKYLKSFGENRKIKRPDVLLFPDEGKCIIIEFKDPDVNASEHLTQIDFYAFLIRNFTIDKIQITTFYGYLIGENIDPRDVRGRVSRYENSYHFDYLFRPSEKVVGETPRNDGSIYTEVIKYSTLIKRASIRNKVFIDKLIN